MRYCVNCVYPETKPGITFDASGICSGCRNQRAKHSIDWEARLGELRRRLAGARRQSGYDCLIPVSGGKDSHAQVYYVKKVLGLNPLCAAVLPQVPTEIGRRNLENLVRHFDVDLVAFRARDEVARRAAVAGFRKNAWPNWAHDKLIYSWPLKLAAAHRIPFVVMGENHDFESGGKDLGEGAEAARQMQHSLGGDVDWSQWEAEGLSRQNLLPYQGPSLADLKAAGSQVIWLGHYIDWDSDRIRLLAEQNGFRARTDLPEGQIDNYSGLDDAIVMINAWLKFIKFGFARVSDVAFNHINYKRMSRAEAIKLVNEREGVLDPEYRKAWIEYTGMSGAEFDEVVMRFMNRDIVKYSEGRWRLRSPAN